ncbi:unnamed protein product [Cyclocybe aegerita]|uniref:Uncharacterized protein n=1 Tax=Cyclocybe aegerita TaxID=1973307 RepID=A0A8S0X0W2_CYCAE|nr:unnamed protein product [Cyclocybe aegerita]
MTEVEPRPLAVLLNEGELVEFVAVVISSTAALDVSRTAFELAVGRFHVPEVLSFPTPAQPTSIHYLFFLIYLRIDGKNVQFITTIEYLTQSPVFALVVSNGTTLSARPIVPPSETPIRFPNGPGSEAMFHIRP